ncbi:MAG: ADP-ribosylglycohydrolase family protein [bacterium]|nr:ADP-ribosylglycohydrolase family protein [bacterium]
MNDQIPHLHALARALMSLEGLSVGDAFGEQFFNPAHLRAQLTSGVFPTGGWTFTDDTNMALSVYAILRQHQHIHQNTLAQSFAAHFDPARKYGAGATQLLRFIRRGGDWREGSRAMFGGQGSYGNGGAMRVAPLGAFFHHDLAKAAEQARLSAEVTHAHPEGIAGAVAVAVAAGVACTLRGSPPPARTQFIDLVLPHVPPSEVHSKIARARDLSSSISLEGAVSLLGNGSQISAQDTVGYCLWCAGELLGNYEQALWLTAAGGGDIDTNCAIVGGIVACYTGVNGIPSAWRAAREPLPNWPFSEDME